MVQKLLYYFSYPFVRYALISSMLISLCSSLAGVTLVLKRYSYIGDGLSHVAFGAFAVAAAARVTNNMLIILPVTVAAAILMLVGGRNRKIKGDAMLAMVSVGSLAAGYLIMNRFSKSSNVSGDVCTSLFGSASILTLSERDVIVCAALSSAVILLFVIFYNRIFAVTFDETYVSATGGSASGINFMLAVMSAVIIVMGMNLAGSLLVSALIIFPAVSSMRVFKSFKAVTISSAVFGVVCTFLGIASSVLMSLPVGSAIVACDALGFVLFAAAGGIKKMMPRKKSSKAFQE